MELVERVEDAHQSLMQARQHGIDAVRVSGKSDLVRGFTRGLGLIKVYAVVSQIQADNPRYRQYGYGERLAFTSGVLEELGWNL